MFSPHRELKRRGRVQTDRRRAKYDSSVKKKLPEYDHKKLATKCCKKEPKARKELEEGEVSGEESSNSSMENPLPVCRFFVRNKCTWGPDCRFKHPPYKSTGNYVMFERQMLPTALPIASAYYEPPPPSSTWLAPTEHDDSFDNNLSDLKELMHNVGYKVSKPKVIHKPWIEFNDLDTDPYYSQRSPPQQAAAQQPWALEPQRQVTLHINSDSSTPDYSSTTNSLSSTCSSSFLGRSRKRPRSRFGKHHLLSSSSSCVSESSSTHSSEHSFFSSREHSRHKRRRESSLVSLRSLKRSRLTRLEHLESRLKEIEERIYRKRARRE